MKTKFILSIAFALAIMPLMAQTWIWYPGDLDIWMGNKINNLRTERGS